MTQDEIIEMAREAGCVEDKHYKGEVIFISNDALERFAKLVAAKAIAELESQEPVSKYCCHLCFNKSGSLLLDRMILCSECGNKRCPKATNHELQCTNSNEPNQAGSVFTHPPQRKPLTDEEFLDWYDSAIWGNEDFKQCCQIAFEAGWQFAHDIKE